MGTAFASGQCALSPVRRARARWYDAAEKAGATRLRCVGMAKPGAGRMAEAAALQEAGAAALAEPPEPRTRTGAHWSGEDRIMQMLGHWKEQEGPREEEGADERETGTEREGSRERERKGSGQSTGREAVGGSELYFDVGRDKEPLVYCSSYDVTFLGLEKMHPFDSTKWRRALAFLVEAGHLTRSQVVAPKEASEEDLLRVHTHEYLDKLRWSSHVAQVVELPFVAFIPNALVQARLLRPFRFQVGGSVVAGKLALERGWAINMGGGFHHCCAHQGGGFCAYADITLLVHFARSQAHIQRVMIIDLDAHQGNGHERDFLGDEHTFIFDMYNRDIYPQDHKAKSGIHLKVELPSGTGTEEYLSLLDTHLQNAFSSFVPELVVYNAGTDILEGDPLGCLRISQQGVIQRDEMVFRACRCRSVPVVMLTSGGYQQSNAEVIARSIGNLAQKKLVSLSAATDNDSLL